MTIHDMLNSAATDIRSMEMKLDMLERELADERRTNDKLRESYTKSETKRINAETDLVHYRNLFVANVCKEAIDICKDMFEITHKNMLGRADQAVQRMVEEKVDKEREESAARPASNIIDEEEAFQKLAPTAEQVRAALAAQPENDTVIQAPEGMSLKEMKLFYKGYLNYLPTNYSSRPVFYMAEGQWHEKGSFHNKDNGKPIPQFLSNREPREDLRGGISKLVLATFGG